MSRKRKISSGMIPSGSRFSVGDMVRWVDIGFEDPLEKESYGLIIGLHLAGAIVQVRPINNMHEILAFNPSDLEMVRSENV